MKHRAGLDRSQTLLFPERLEDYIGPENPVRFLDAFVAQLDLHALGFDKARCAGTACVAGLCQSYAANGVSCTGDAMCYSGYCGATGGCQPRLPCTQ